MPSDPMIESWLERLSMTGAMERKNLINRIELTLMPWSEEVRMLGSRRVATILSQRRWRNAYSAEDFLVTRS